MDLVRAAGHLGFIVKGSDIRGDIFVPRYYNPEITQRLKVLSRTHELYSIQDLIDSGHLEMSQGNYIGKMNYGTGVIPYIRTSDIANWELKGSPKQGVSEDVYLRFKSKQDIREGDILLVHEGTYLIGVPCLITEYDTRILFQHHLAKLRVGDDSPVTSSALMALLLSPIVQAQIRARQFTADIIDSIVGRLQEVVLPVPKNATYRAAISKEAAMIFTGRAESRVHLAQFMRALEDALADGTASRLPTKTTDLETNATGQTGLLGERNEAQSFVLPANRLVSDIFIPSYYDPQTKKELRRLTSNCDLKSIGDLVADGTLELGTGDEVGKLAYGGGDIAFIRTSDLAHWELKHDPKQRIAQEEYDRFAKKQRVAMEDILLVRDGTYLVGTSAMVFEDDLPLLYSGGIYRLKVTEAAYVTPYLLLALLNSKVVLRQMRNKQFTRDIIDTLGHRFEEVVLPIPKDKALRSQISKRTEELLRARHVLRGEAKSLGPRIERNGP